jgi:hypothetical protein
LGRLRFRPRKGGPRTTSSTGSCPTA